MREYIYKVIIFAIAIIIIFEFTIGKEISHINEKVSYFTSSDGRKEMRKANEKENYLDEEERVLIRDFIIKIKKELALN